MKKIAVLWIAIITSCTLLSACANNQNQSDKSSSAASVFFGTNGSVAETSTVSANQTSVDTETSGTPMFIVRDTYKWYFNLPADFAAIDGMYVKDGDTKNGVFATDLNKNVEKKYFADKFGKDTYLSSWVDTYKKDGTLEEKNIIEYPTKVSADAVKITLNYKTPDNIEMTAIIYAAPLEDNNVLILECQYERSKNMEKTFDDIANSLEIVNI